VNDFNDGAVGVLHRARNARRFLPGTARTWRARIAAPIAVACEGAARVRVNLVGPGV